MGLLLEEVPKTPPGADDIDWLAKLKKAYGQTIDDVIEDMTPQTKHLKPRKGGIWALATTSIDWIAFLVECMVFETFLLEESCQVEIMHAYQYMCPHLEKSELKYRTGTYLDFAVKSLAVGVVSNAWTLSYAKSGFTAYTNAALIFLDACRLVCDLEPYDVIID